MESATVEIGGVPDFSPSDPEGWVMAITCPRCGAPAEPTGKAFTFGVFDGRSYLCEECGKSFNAYYRDQVFIHTVPKAEVKLIGPVEREVDGAPDSGRGDPEGWVKNITCPRCGAPTEPTGKAFAFGVFDGRGYRCDGCGKYFSAYYRDHMFSHTVPRAEVELIDPEEMSINEPEMEITEVEDDETMGADSPPLQEEKPRIRVEEGLRRTEAPRPPRSADEVLESLRVLKEDVTFIGELGAEEADIVDAFFLDFLKITTAFDGEIQIDVSILPLELEEIERASVTARGGLLILFRDGHIESVDLTKTENRDLLVAVIHNALPKLAVLSTRNRVMIERRLKYLTAASKELQKMASSLPERLKPSTHPYTQ